MEFAAGERYFKTLGPASVAQTRLVTGAVIGPFRKRNRSSRPSGYPPDTPILLLKYFFLEAKVSRADSRTATNCRIGEACERIGPTTRAE